LLREVKKLTRVKLALDEAAAITQIRLRMLSNGFVPIPNRDKRTLFTGWNSLDPDEAEVRAWLNDRASLTVHAATGAQVVGELLGLDVDVPDVQMALAIRLAISAIAPQLGEARGALERGRDDASPKFMLFCRRGASPPFTIQSGKWSTDPEEEDAPTFQIEVFSSERNQEGKVARQIGCFGPHTVNDETGEVKVRYAWRGPSPADVPLGDLPVLTQEQALRICEEADRIFEAAGLRPLKGYKRGLVKLENVYDLDEATRFDGADFADITLAELVELFWQNDALGLETRCSGSFTGEGGTRMDRCQVGWSGGDKATGHITVHDHAEHRTHRPATEKPVPGLGIEKPIADLVELFKDLPPDGDKAQDDAQSTSFADRMTAAIGQAAADALTEHALALAIAKLYGDRLCYVPAEKQWLRFEAPRWVNETAHRIESMIIGIFCRAIPLPRTPAGNSMRKQLEAHRHYSAIERLLRGLLEYKDGFDKNPYLVAGPLMVVNLRTGEARLGRPKDRIRLSWKFDPSPREDCPRWLKFVEEVTSGDREIALLLQMWAGMGLCGDPSHQMLMFLHGAGRNGKNVYADTMVAITGGAPGGYSLSIRFETFVAKKYGSEHPADVWALKGKRMITASEVPDGAEWDTQRIKGLTGDGTQQARGMHQNFETFDRTWTVTLLGNNKPKFKNVDTAIRSRIRIVPFDRNFEDEGIMDIDLPKKLLEEGPGILRWAINGLLAVKKNGLVEPKRVKKETDAYLDKHDIRMRFIADHIEKTKADDNTATPLAEFYAAWCGYAEASGVEPHSEGPMAKWLVKLAGGKSGARVDAVIGGEMKRRIAAITGIRLKAGASGSLF
jgi:putative DNA primase/helicase